MAGDAADLSFQDLFLLIELVNDVYLFLAFTHISFPFPCMVTLNKKAWSLKNRQCRDIQYGVLKSKI